MILMVTPDDRRVVWTENDEDQTSRLYAASLDDEAAEPELVLELDSFMLLIEVSPDGRHARAYNGQGTTHADLFVDLESGAFVESPSAGMVAWSRDGEWAARSTDYTSAYAIRLADGEQFAHETPSYEVDVLTACGDGYVAAYGENLEYAGAGWFAFAEEAQLVPLAETRVVQATCSSDHEILAWKNVTGHVYLASMKGDGPGEPAQLEVSLGGPTRGLAWSPDGSALGFERCEDGTGLQATPCRSTITAYVPETGDKTVLFEGRSTGFSLLPLL